MAVAMVAALMVASILAYSLTFLIAQFAVFIGIVLFKHAGAHGLSGSLTLFFIEFAVFISIILLHELARHAGFAGVSPLRTVRATGTTLTAVLLPIGFHSSLFLIAELAVFIGIILFEHFLVKTLTARRLRALSRPGKLLLSKSRQYCQHC